ncbi:MAG: T9SS type A sorting domain-containing protein [bacterium]|nr:T9SS type A sorting domain-containing protein [Candidatus Kapabacteria bacterium]
MRSIITTLLIALTASASSAVAQTDVYSVKRSKTSSVEYHISNYGIFGLDVASAKAGFIFPRNSRTSYLFGAGLWFGAMKTVNDSARKLVFLTYNPNTGASWAVPGDFDSALNDRNHYYSGDYDRQTGLNTSSPPTPAWPLWLPGFTSTSTRYPGTFEPNPSLREVGPTYVTPSFMPNVDEQFVARYNDGDVKRYEGFEDQFGFPLGLQFTQNTYSWSTGEYVSAVVIQYEVVNTSNDTLRDCIIGQVSDPDLGVSTNDRVGVFRGTDGKARAGVAYSEPEGGALMIDALAQILLESPVVGESGFIDNSRREELSRMHEIRTFRNWELRDDPTTLADRYEYLNGPVLEDDDAAGDKRTLLAGEPFSMLPGDTAHFAIAYGVVNSPFDRVHDKDDSPSLQKVGNPAAVSLDELIASLLGDFDRGFFTRSVASDVNHNETSNAAFAIRPNPAVHSATIEFPVSTASNVTLSIYNAMGERVAIETLGDHSIGTHRAEIDVAGLVSGNYVVVVNAGATRNATMLVVSK